MDEMVNLILYFAVYSFLGWIMETAFASFKERKFINRGFLTGFFCPIYGFGAIIIIQAFEGLNKLFGTSNTMWPFYIVIATSLVTVLEYMTGYLLEKIFRCKWWDYSEFKDNLHGYICFRFSLLWGILTFILMQVVHPIVAETIMATPLKFRGSFIIVLGLYFLTDTIKSIGETLGLRAVILNQSKYSISRYYEKILAYKRIFIAFPRLLILNTNILNGDIRSILNEKVDKIKIKLKRRFL